MRTVEFVDTSVLCNFLDVPGKNQDRDEVRKSMREKVDGGVQLIIPISAVVEAGNHITQLRDGAARRACAERFATTLRAIAAGELPWVLHQVAWDEQFLVKLCDGVAGTGPFVECATQGLGAGDLAILVERELYLERSAIERAGVWTLDAQLAAYAQ